MALYTFVPDRSMWSLWSGPEDQDGPSLFWNGGETVIKRVDFRKTLHFVIYLVAVICLATAGLILGLILGLEWIK